MENNAIILDNYMSEFSKEFADAVHRWYSIPGNRDNAYQRWYFSEKDLKDYDGDYLIISKELIEKGFTGNEILLFDNTW